MGTSKPPNKVVQENKAVKIITVMMAVICIMGILVTGLRMSSTSSRCRISSESVITFCNFIFLFNFNDLLLFVG